MEGADDNERAEEAPEIGSVQLTEEETNPEPVPNAFVKWAEFPAILGQANTAGVRCTFLMKQDGSLLSVAGEDEVGHATCGLVSNIWRSYLTDAQEAIGAKELDYLLIKCEKGTVAMTSIGRFILAICADESVPAGILKAKVFAIANFLQEPLNLVFSSDSSG